MAGFFFLRAFQRPSRQLSRLLYCEDKLFMKIFHPHVVLVFTPSVIVWYDLPLVSIEMEYLFPQNLFFCELR